VTDASFLSPPAHTFSLAWLAAVETLDSPPLVAAALGAHFVDIVAVARGAAVVVAVVEEGRRQERVPPSARTTELNWRKSSNRSGSPTNSTKSSGLREYKRVCKRKGGLSICIRYVLLAF
jgi:hypothetical protein